MTKKLIKLTESDLHNIIKESVNKVLTELDWKTYANASRKWADELKKNPAHPKRKSSIIGHENSKGTHDIPTDDRLRNFNSAMQNSFNRDYGFNNTYPIDMNKGTYNMQFNSDNIGSHGYYDSIGTETHVPHNKAVVGKTKDGKRTETILRDRFNMDSFDGRDKYPSKRHEAHIGFDKKYDSRDAVEPDMDRWDFMDARNKGNQEILDYVNGEYDYLDGKWLKGGFSIFGDEESTEKETFRPFFCYAHGKLEDDLGFDIFKMDSIAKNKVMASDGRHVKRGTYKCNYHGKPCTLYIGFNKEKQGPDVYGLCYYNDDKDAISYVEENLM